MNVTIVTRWFRNPYYSSGPLAARVGVNGGTIIWGSVVLSREHALDGNRFAAYATMLSILREDAWGSIALCLSLPALVRLLAKAPPHWSDGIGYFLLMMAWNYFALTLLIDYAYPLPPASIAGIGVVAGFSVYAFLSKKKTVTS